MNDVVLVPTYLRPEYLWLCLEKLAEAKGVEDKRIWIHQDVRPNDQITWGIVLKWQEEVFEHWKKHLDLSWFKMPEHNYPGNSYNVLRAYQRAFYESGARNVYLVEDDVLVTPDFFAWHESMAEREPDAMCSIAYRCSRNSEARTDVTDPGAYFSTARDYASIGVRWNSAKLVPLMEHIKPDYLISQDAYMLKRFSGNRFAGDFAEQDGLIMRIMWDHRWFTVWPYVPRCYHMGWYGYHRPNGFRPNGWLQQKVDVIRSMISDPDALRRAAPDFGDIEPFRGGYPEGGRELTKLQHFD